MSRVIAVMACGFALAACSASLPSLGFFRSSPPTEALRIESDPPGAEARTSLGQSCRTPCQLTVKTDAETAVTLALNGYEPQTVIVRTPSASDEPEAADLAPRLAPNPVYVELQTASVPVAKKKPPAKRKPVSGASPAPASAAAAWPPAPATRTESAVSATNYPWPSQ